MSRQTQIEEMAQIVSNAIKTWVYEAPPMSNPNFVAAAIYDAGYRKQSEGEWLELKRFYASGKTLVHYQCNLCGVYLAKQANYCPSCGAKMKGV